MSETYVAFTASGYEHKVLQAIRQYILLPGEDAYCPIRVLIKRIHGIDREVKSDLYPGYIFLKTNDPKGIFFRGKAGKGQTIFQYIYMLRNGEYILPISDEEEEMLNRLCGEDHCCDFSYGYMEGDQIVITSGPLVDFTGSIKKINRHKKTARITTRLLNRNVDITVGLEIVKKI